jgi:general secretion pathway protein D
MNRVDKQATTRTDGVSQYRPAAFWALIAALGVASCGPVNKTDDGAVTAARPVAPAPTTSSARVDAESASPAAPAAATSVDVSAAADTHSTQAEYYPGRPQAIRDHSQAAITSAETGEVTLNFQNADLQEVINVILGDMLKVNFTVDPRVRGTVTVQTSRPLAKAELLPTLESFLAMNGAVLVRGDGVYRILPVAGAEKLAGRAGAEAGYGIRIVPLKYISASEMQNILQPLIGEGAALRIEERHNVVLLRGTGEQLANLLDTIETFDVDWLRGMSVGLFTLRHAEAKQLADEVKQLFGTEDEALYRNLLRVVPIERLNAVLVISPQQTYVHEAGEWITRLDRPSEEAGQRLYVYRAQNSRASDLAAVLASVLNPEAQAGAPPPPLGIAPGETPVLLGDGGYTRTLTTPPTPLTTAPDATEVAGGAPIPEPIGESTTGIPSLQPSTRADSTQPPFSADIVLPQQKEAIRVIADEAHNSVVILATAEQYKMIEQALKQLDVLPLQVLIEATIVEVTLSDSLQYGVEWLFTNKVKDDFGGVGKLDLGAAGLNALVPGFSYAVTASAGDIRAVLNLLAQDNRLEVLSSPSLMVLDNQEAIIQVGNQVPITVQQQQSTVVGGTGTAPIINSIQYRDTGVILAVTPRVNASGLITMDVAQEVSDVSSTTSLTPTILQRKIASTVAVQSGDTIVLGGLIRDNKNNTESGIPGLYKLPLLGKLFGTTQLDTSRTELLVVITPRAVTDQSEARRATEEMRSKLRGLPPIESSIVLPPAPAPAAKP